LERSLHDYKESAPIFDGSFSWLLCRGCAQAITSLLYDIVENRRKATQQNAAEAETPAA
jgi:hypothetical protein